MNSSSRQFLWPIFVLVSLVSLAATTAAFRVLESPSTSNSANYYPNNQKNQQTAFITSLLPPLPVSTTASAPPWGTPTTTSPTNGQRRLDNNKQPNCNIAGVNLSKAVVERKNHLSHPLWYDDHNPTARKVKYFDDCYENGYVSTWKTICNSHDAYTHSQCWSNTIDTFSSRNRSETIPFFAFADHWAEDSASSLNEARLRRRPMVNLWRRAKQWYRRGPPSA
jgi:hypothetical protein